MALCLALTPIVAAQQRPVDAAAPQRALQAVDAQAETVQNAVPASSIERPAVLSASDPVGMRTGVELFNNGPISNRAGTAMNGGDESVIFTDPAPEIDNTTFGYNTNFPVAFIYEDFVIPEGKGWDIDRFVMYAYQTGAIGSTTSTTLDSVRVTVYPEDPVLQNGPDFANPILNCGTTADSLAGIVPVAAVSATNVFRVTQTTSGTNVDRQLQRVEAATNGTCKLSGGIYWIEYQIGGTAASGPWNPTVPDRDVEPATQCYGGNGLQLTSDGFFILQNGFCSVSFPIRVIGKEQSSQGPANIAQKGGQYVITDTTAFNENFKVSYDVCNKTPNPLSGSTRFRVFLKPSMAQVASGTLVSGTVPPRTCVNLMYQQNVPQTAPTATFKYCVQAAASPSGPTVAESCVPLDVIDARSGPRPAASEAWSVVEVTPWPDATVSAAVTVAPGEIAAFPNPFARETNLAFSLTEAADVRLAVYDVLGREVAVLADGPMEAGDHTATFEARGLASGTYVYRLTAGDVVRSGRITLMN